MDTLTESSKLRNHTLKYDNGSGSIGTRLSGGETGESSAQYDSLFCGQLNLDSSTPSIGSAGDRLSKDQEAVEKSSYSLEINFITFSRKSHQSGIISNIPNNRAQYYMRRYYEKTGAQIREVRNSPKIYESMPP